MDYAQCSLQDFLEGCLKNEESSLAIILCGEDDKIRNDLLAMDSRTLDIDELLRCKRVMVYTVPNIVFFTDLSSALSLEPMVCRLSVWGLISLHKNCNEQTPCFSAQGIGTSCARLLDIGKKVFLTDEIGLCEQLPVIHQGSSKPLTAATVALSQVLRRWTTVDIGRMTT
jgi:hypothetical protein